ncbi:MAG: tyrosine-type recombinase/integrase [Chloroflexota bacterium]
MHTPDNDIQWDLYPHVAATPPARAFLVRLRQFGRRPKTIDAYARNLDRFLASFADAGGAPGAASAGRWVEADEGTLLTYLDGLRHERRTGASRPAQPAGPARWGRPANVRSLAGARAADATVAQHAVALRQFYDYLIRARLRRDGVHPLPRGRLGEAATRGLVRTRGRLPWIAPTDVWERIVLHVVTRETARNRAMVLIAYDGALRREELVRLRGADYDRQRALLKVRAETSKSRRDRWVPLSPFGQRALDHYLDRQRRALVAAYGLDEHGPLFLSESTRNPGRPLVPGAFNDVVEALRAALDLPQLHPHTFRHQRLTALKVAGVPLEDIALFAGHASTETTRLYLHLAPVELGQRIRMATRGMDAHLERLLQEQLRHRSGDGP